MIEGSAPRHTELVVIGASAGAVSALSHIVPALPVEFAPATAVVVHLPPRSPSLMVSVLSARTSLRVVEIEDKQPILPGVVYTAPADYHVLIESDGRFSLNVDDPVHYSRPSVDVLFQSAAFVYAERALGIVLTGANADGAAGLRAIRDAGGFTVVQDPGTAAVAEMPRAAIAAANPHAILDLDGIANLLRSLPRRGLKA
jgi:two-component system chemotaxis response regulator CheB